MAIFTVPAAGARAVWLGLTYKTVSDVELMGRRHRRREALCGPWQSRELSPDVVTYRWKRCLPPGPGLRGPQATGARVGSGDPGLPSVWTQAPAQHRRRRKAVASTRAPAPGVCQGSPAAGRQGRSLSSGLSPLPSEAASGLRALASC